MMPPICCICLSQYREEPGQSLDDSFVLVYFADVPEMPPGWAGHPRGALWFCREHAYLGMERESMTSTAAIAEINLVHPQGSPPSNTDRA